MSLFSKDSIGPDSSSPGSVCPGFMRMERNLYRSNDLPSRPTRRWRNSTGPLELSATAMAVQMMTGISSTSSTSAKLRSRACLIMNCTPRGLTIVKDIRGRPPTVS